jgi:hypothetical protein
VFYEPEGHIIYVRYKPKTQKKMKNTKLKLIIAAASILLNRVSYGQHDIPPEFFGLNHWFTDYRGAPQGTISTPNSTVYTYARETMSKNMRNGGTAYDVLLPGGDYLYPYNIVNGYKLPTPAGYVKLADDIRAQGFEPKIQVPFDERSKTRGLEEQAQWAAEIVRQVNIVHKRNVKFWIIGNEPSIDQTYTTTTNGMRGTRDYMLLYSVQMKKVDPNIIIIGPELNWADPGYLTPLLADPGSNNTSISGTIGATFNNISTGGAQTKYFCDYLSYHSYPGFAPVFTTNAVPVRQRYANASYTLAADYQSIYSSYISGNSYNSHYKIIIDECNMSHSCTTGGTCIPSSQSNTTIIAAEALDANTFLAGQMVSCMLGSILSATSGANTGLYEGCNIWSMKEGDHLGLIDNSTDRRKPTYWHYWLMSRYFRGKFCRNLATDPGDGNVGRCYKAYGCKGPNYLAVLVVNMAKTGSPDAVTTAASAKNFTISFGNQSGDFIFNMGLTNV